MQWFENDEGRIINIELVRCFRKDKDKVYAVFGKGDEVSVMLPKEATVDEVWEAIKKLLKVSKLLKVREKGRKANWSDYQKL